MEEVSYFKSPNNAINKYYFASFAKTLDIIIKKIYYVLPLVSIYSQYTIIKKRKLQVLMLKLISD